MNPLHMMNNGRKTIVSFFGMASEELLAVFSPWYHNPAAETVPIPGHVQDMVEVIVAESLSKTKASG